MITNKKHGFVAVVIGILVCSNNIAQGRTTTSNPQIILRRMIAQYASASSYQDSGTVRVLPGDLALTRSVNSPLFQSVSLKKDDTLVSFKTYFARPRMFRFEWRNSFLRASRESVIWSDGKQAYSWLPDAIPGKGGFLLEKEADLNSCIDNAIGSSSGAAFFVPSLLLRDVNNFPFGDMVNNMTGLSLLREEQLDGEACHVIKGNISGVPWVLWVGKKTYLLRKTRTLYSGGSFHETVGKRIDKTLMAEEIHRDIKVNAVIPKEVFTYRPQLQANDIDLTR